MDLGTLLTDGQRKLDARREAYRIEREAADAKAAAELAAYRATIDADIRRIIPEPLWPYLSYKVDEVNLWSIDIHICAPDCAPIEVAYQPRDGKIGKYVIPGIDRGWFDAGEGYPPCFSTDRRRATAEDDPTIALALARESWDVLDDMTQQYERQLSEHQAEVAQRTAAAPAPAAAAPSLAEQLVDLIYRIAHGEAEY